MDAGSINEGVRPEPHQSEEPPPLKTCEIYKVKGKLPERFNQPDCFRGYSKKTVHPLYRTTNQTYGGRKPTVHEMPTSFHAKCQTFSEHILRNGMFQDHGFNTSLDKSRISGPNTITIRQDRISFHNSYQGNGSGSS